MNVDLMRFLSREIVERGKVVLLLTPWSTVLEKLIVSQLLNKFTLLWSVLYAAHKILPHEPNSHLTLFLLHSKNKVLARCNSVSLAEVSRSECRQLLFHFPLFPSRLVPENFQLQVF